MDGQVGTRRTKGPGWASASMLVMALIVMTAVLVALLPPGIGRAFPSGPAGTIATYASGFSTPAGIASDSAGNLYVAGDTICNVIQVKPNLSQITLVGNTCGAAPLLNHPGGLAVDAADTTLYIADTSNCLVRSVPVTGGPLTTVAGNGTCGYAGDGGPATSAELNNPAGVALDSSGNLYIADTLNCRIREVSGGTITTLAGNGTCNNPVGLGTVYTSSTPFPPPVDLAVQGSSLYVSTGAVNGVCQAVRLDFFNDAQPPIYTDASCLTFAGNHVGVSSSGSMYASFADSTCEVKAVTGNQVAITVAGMATCGYSGDGGPATSAEISSPGGLAVDGAGNLYISDTSNNVVRIVYAPVFCGASGTDPDGNCDTDFSNPGPAQPCIQDHIGDANGDGYSDSDELTPPVALMCTGAYPPGGGLGLAGLSSATIDGPCPGRAPASLGAKTARADVNVDGVVNIFDLSAVAGVYGQSGFASNPYDKRNEFDENGDGVINIFDLSIVASVYGKAVPPC